MSRLVITILLISLTIPLPLRAEEVESSIKTHQDKLEVIEEKITTAEEKIERSSEKEVTILGNLELLDRDISSKRRNIRTLRTKETVLVKAIAQSEDDLALIRKEKEHVRRRLVNRAVALYKAG
ncbi:MAG: hypothetical protein V3R44_05405, partial [bacterium]